MNAMATAQAQENYYCHRCRREIVPNLEDFTCPSCNSGFIEAVAPGRNEFELEFNITNTNEASSAQLFEFMRTFLQNPAVAASAMYDDNEEDEEGDDPPGPRSNRRRNAARHPATRTSREQIPSRFPDPSGRSQTTARLQLTQSENPFLFRVLSFLQPLQSDIRNYAFSQEMFDQIVTQLMNQLQVGPPPATENSIAALRSMVLTAEQAVEYSTCSICFDDYTKDETVTKLPCEHIYHEGCISRWLKLHGTCPVCRKDLAGHDTTIPEDQQHAPTADAPGSSESESGPSFFNYN